jgi:hypothetical protein
MRTRRKYLKTHLTRPRKGGAAKRRRQADQKKRLVAFGLDEAEVAKMCPRTVLTKLKYPKKLVAELQK